MRNLHLHRAAFAKLRARPELREKCLQLVNRWISTHAAESSESWLRQWQEMLTSWEIDRIERVVLDESGGQTLRQCSPLGPTLTPKERWQLFREITALLNSGVGAP